jgi:hypothetical protein
MLERWQQVYQTGEAALHPFTQAELDSVILDADALPAAERGPFLQAMTPLTGQETAPGAAAPGRDPALGRAGAPPEGLAAARAQAAASLERQGFLRSGPPATPSAEGPARAELAGWAAGPAGDLTARKQVTLVGDLAIITRIRSQPVWVAEATVSPAPSRPDSPSIKWRLLARMYAPFRPPVGLIEMPAGADGGTDPFVLVRDDRAVHALVSWCGADVAEAQSWQGSASPDPATPPRAGAAQPSRDAALPGPVPTAEQAAAFASLVQLRVAVADQDQVLVRNLVVATGAAGHWLLEGEWWQRAVPVTADGLARRVAALLKLPGGVAGR